MCFGLRVARPDLLGALAVIIAGSAIRAVAQRLRGGGGVLGGAAGGAMAYMGLLATLYVWLYRNPQKKTWIADPANAFLFAAVYGGSDRLCGGFAGGTCRFPFRSRARWTGDL